MFSSTSQRSFRFLKYFAAAAIIAALLSLPFLISDSGVSTAAGSGQVSVIVELKDEPGAVYKARAEKAGGTVSQEQLMSYRNQLAAKQDDFLNALAARGIGASVVTRDIKGFDGNVAATIPLRYTLVLDGLALKVDKSQLAVIRSMPQVKRVSYDEQLTPWLNHSVAYTRAPQLYGEFAEVTQFDTHNEGYEGQGMYVSIIDTGIDWRHPMFGGDPTPPRLAVMPWGPTGSKTNQKVVYYLPLTDIAVQDGFGHGTHVASTVAGFLGQTQDGTRLHGVAPQAKLLSYKVCSDTFSSIYAVTGVPLGGCASSDTIMAIEDSVSPFTLNNPNLPKPVAHVINMSLGGGGGPDNPTARAASNAALDGCIVVAASGNSGPGEATTGSPAAGTHVISVGATTHPGSAAAVWSTDLLIASAVPATRLGAVSPANQFATAPNSSHFRIFAMSGSAPLPASAMAQRYVYVNNPTVTWPASVSGRIVLLRDITVAATNFDVVAQAANAGAVGIIIADSRGAVNGVKTTIPAATIDPADFEVLVDALSSTDNNNVDPPSGAVSELPIRMNPRFSDTFTGDMADFSSRGPVRGLGQVKPDISAPGVQVFAGVPPASLIGGLAAIGLDPEYYRLDGTSMATPHVAGAVTLIKQAHGKWSPDVVRTVLINTATNMRDQAGAPKADGPDADSIIAQGGGLIDVYHAVHARAMMGVASADPLASENPDLAAPAFLGSHSYGEVPVVNNRITYTAPVTVTIRDLSGEGGTYNLNVANNRDLELSGINVSTSAASVSVPANGSATFTVNATFNGDQIRDVMAAKTAGTSVIFEKIQMQWYVTATRGDGKESLRMPFFFRPGYSQPATPIVVTSQVSDIMPAGDSGVQRDVLEAFQPELDGVTYKDIPFAVDAATLRIEALTEWAQAGETGHPDIDYQLLDPDGNVIQQSGNGVGPEYVNVRVSRAGTYTHRVIGYTSVATEFTVTTTLTKGPAAPTAQAFAGDFVNSQSQQVDFDGNVTLNWTPVGGELGYEIEKLNAETSDWDMVASVAGGTTSYNFTGLADGTHSFRIRGIHPGQIGKFVTTAGNAAQVLVSTRSKVDITSQISYPVSNVSLSGGVWQQDVNLINNSTNTYLPFVDFTVLGITSASGNVKVLNADNGKDGRTPANAAVFGFTSKLGSDQVFSPAETTGSRTIRFQNAGELFSWDVQATAYIGTGSGSSSSAQSTSSGNSGSSSSTGGLPAGNLPLMKVTAVMRFTANPLTKTVTSQLISVTK